MKNSIIFLFLLLILFGEIKLAEAQSNKICCHAECQKNGEVFYTVINVTGFTNNCSGKFIARDEATNQTIKCELKSKAETCGETTWKIIGEDFSGGIVQCKNDPCSIEDLFNNIQRFLRFIVQFAFWFAVIISVTGAFLWMWGGPFPNLQAQGKSMIKTAIIGYILLFLVVIFFDIVLEFLGPKFQWER